MILPIWTAERPFPYTLTIYSRDTNPYPQIRTGAAYILRASSPEFRRPIVVTSNTITGAESVMNSYLRRMFGYPCAPTKISNRTSSLRAGRVLEAEQRALLLVAS